MKETFERLRDAIASRLEGIYGFDQLGGTILVLAAIFLALAGNDHIVLRLIALVLLAIDIYRAFSRNHEARIRENDRFMALLEKPLAWLKGVRRRWDNRATKAYVRCPSCKKQFALPKGKGTLRATCPYCGEKSVHKV